MRFFPESDEQSLTVVPA